MGTTQNGILNIFGKVGAEQPAGAGAAHLRPPSTRRWDVDQAEASTPDRMVSVSVLGAPTAGSRWHRWEKDWIQEYFKGGGAGESRFSLLISPWFAFDAGRRSQETRR